MNTEDFYRYISFQNGLYYVMKDKESYGAYRNVCDALYERDRLMAVDWDWELSMEIPEIPNKYYHTKLPPFSHTPLHISIDNECWVVRGKGREQKHYGTFFTEEEAKDVARLHSANIAHKNKAYRVQRRINGKTKYFGRFKTLDEAKKRVEWLNQNGWDLNDKSVK
jgi:hypothetical protein